MPNKLKLELFKPSDDEPRKSLRLPMWLNSVLSGIGWAAVVVIIAVIANIFVRWLVGA